MKNWVTRWHLQTDINVKEPPNFGIFVHLKGSRYSTLILFHGPNEQTNPADAGGYWPVAQRHNSALTWEPLYSTYPLSCCPESTRKKTLSFTSYFHCSLTQLHSLPNIFIMNQESFYNLMQSTLNRITFVHCYFFRLTFYFFRKPSTICISDFKIHKQIHCYKDYNVCQL